MYPRHLACCGARFRDKSVHVGVGVAAPVSAAHEPARPAAVQAHHYHRDLQCVCQCHLRNRRTDTHTNTPSYDCAETARMPAAQHQNTLTGCWVHTIIIVSGGGRQQHAWWQPPASFIVCTIAVAMIYPPHSTHSTNTAPAIHPQCGCCRSPQPSAARSAHRMPPRWQAGRRTCPRHVHQNAHTHSC